LKYNIVWTVVIHISQI